MYVVRSSLELVGAVDSSPDFAGGDEQKVRDHLGRFGFEGDRAFDLDRAHVGADLLRADGSVIAGIDGG